jgi:hypothetical protein
MPSFVVLPAVGDAMPVAPPLLRFDIRRPLTWQSFSMALLDVHWVPLAKQPTARLCLPAEKTKRHNAIKKKALSAFAAKSRHSCLFFYFIFLSFFWQQDDNGVTSAVARRTRKKAHPSRTKNKRAY